MVHDRPASSGREIGEELRDVVGIHLAQLVAHCHLDVEDDLATIIPVSDDDPTDDGHWWHRHRSLAIRAVGSSGSVGSHQ